MDEHKEPEIKKLENQVADILERLRLHERHLLTLYNKMEGLQKDVEHKDLALHGIRTYTEKELREYKLMKLKEPRLVYRSFLKEGEPQWEKERETAEEVEERLSTYPFSEDTIEQITKILDDDPEQHPKEKKED